MALPIYDNIPELSGQASAIARRRKIAEAMMAQGQEQLPVNQMAGQVVAPVSFTQGLAKLANAYLGRKSAEDADKAEQGLADKRQQMVADQLMQAKAIEQGSSGVEGIQAQPERTIQAPAPMQEGQVAPNYNTVPEVVPAVEGRLPVPAVAGDKRKAMAHLMASNLPEVQRQAELMKYFDTQDATTELKKQENQANRDLELVKLNKEIEYKKQNGQETRDLEVAKANLMSEDRRYNTDVMSADRRFQVSQASADRRYGVDQKSTNKPISNIDAKSIDKSLEKSSGANGALQLLDQAEELYSRYDSNAAEPILGTTARIGAAVGLGNKQKVQDYETANQIAKDLGVIKLGLIGGSDTERELKVAIETSPSPDKQTATNKNIIANQRRAIEVLQSEPDFKTEWVNKHGSLSAMSDDGKTYGQAWRKFQKDNFKPVTPNGGSGKITKPNSVNIDDRLKKYK